MHVNYFLLSVVYSVLKDLTTNKIIDLTISRNFCLVVHQKILAQCLNAYCAFNYALMPFLFIFYNTLIDIRILDISCDAKYVECG